MGQRGKKWLMIGILCGVLALTPILVNAQDDAEATPEATAATVVTDEATAEATVEAVDHSEVTTEETEAVSAEDEHAATVSSTSDTPQTLFEMHAVEPRPAEETDDPAGIGLLFFLAGIAGIGAIGMAMIGRDSAGSE